MQKTWNVGNTTVRNPKRIDEALRVFYSNGFSGNIKGKVREAALHKQLKESGVLHFDGEASDWNGRKWRAAFYQLGFISYEQYKVDNKKLSVSQFFSKINLPSITSAYQITPAGEKVVNATTLFELQEIFIRQFCCYEIPSILEPSFRKGKMKPFILLLEVLYKLQTNNQPGLNKLETGLFLQKFRNHDEFLAETILQEVLDFRKELLKCKTTKAEKEFKVKQLKLLEKEVGIKPDSVVKDYSDTTFRYFSLSGLLSNVGDTIVIRSNKINFVKELIKDEPNFSYSDSPYKYLERLYKNDYKIPTDNIDVALDEIKQLRSKIKDKNNPLVLESATLSDKTDSSKLKKLRYQLIEYDSWELEEDYAKQLRRQLEIQHTINYLKVLSGDKITPPTPIDDKPAYLEWSVWRAILALNDVVCRAHETRRFPIDQDFYPRSTAPGGGSDLIFEYRDFILVVEVTLTTSHSDLT